MKQVMMFFGICAAATLLAAPTVSNVEMQTYTVGFDIGEYGVRTGGGELSQVVAEGDDAVAPEVNATAAGGMFVGWDCDFSNVRSNVTVRALWERTPFTLNVRSEHGTARPTIGQHSVGWGDVITISMTKDYNFPNVVVLYAA